MWCRLGFTNVKVDDSDSKMTFEELEPEFSEGVEEEAEQSERRRIHVGSAEFKHLENYNMNELCARVVLYGVK